MSLPIRADDRFKVLQLAVRGTDSDTEILDRAAKYMEFVFPGARGTEEDNGYEAPAAVVEGQFTEPGSKQRKRRTKAEMEADAAKGAQPEIEHTKPAELAPPVANEKIPYRKVQERVLFLVNEKNDSAAVVKVLGAFGCKTALELKEAQYGPFLAMLDAEAA